MELEKPFADMKTSEINVHFRSGNMNVYIVLQKDEASEEYSIELNHRMRLGPEILPIPAWLSYEQAVTWLCQKPKIIGEVIQINHAHLQELIDNRKYSQVFVDCVEKYKLGPPIKTYFLDIQH